MTPDQRLAGFRFKCSRCEDLHSGLPVMSFALPDVIHQMSPDERAARCRIGDVTCTLDGAHYFVRCDLGLPIVGASESYTFGVWSTLSAASFELFLDHADCEERASLGPFFGWLANDVVGFPPVGNMKCRVHPQSPGEIPRLELEAIDHPLSVAQHKGLDLDRALELARRTPGVVAVIEGP